MTEGMPPTTPEQLRQLNRDLMEKMLDKAASDPEWKQRLLDDPEAAMIEANFPEAQRLQEMQTSVEAEEPAEVSGHILAFSLVRLAHTDCYNPPYPGAVAPPHKW